MSTLHPSPTTPPAAGCVPEPPPALAPSAVADARRILDRAARRRLAEGMAAGDMESQRAAVLASGEYRQYLALRGNHEGLDALLEVLRYTDGTLPDTDYWRLLADAWTGQDVVHRDLDWWRIAFSSERACRDQLMTETERELLAALPERVTVFRGFCHHGGHTGIAWTLDYDRALFFARFGGSPRMRMFGVPEPEGAWIATATIRRGQVVAIFDARNEAEAIVPDLAEPHADLDVAALTHDEEER